MSEVSKKISGSAGPPGGDSTRGPAGK